MLYLRYAVNQVLLVRFYQFCCRQYQQFQFYNLNNRIYHLFQEFY